MPRPTVGLSIAGTNVPGSREGSYCQTGGCSGVCGDSLAPVAPLTPVRARSPVRLDFSAGAEVDRIHGDVWEGETMTGRPVESFELRGSDRSYTSQVASKPKASWHCGNCGKCGKSVRAEGRQGFAHFPHFGPSVTLLALMRFHVLQN